MPCLPTPQDLLYPVTGAIPLLPHEVCAVGELTDKILRKMELDARTVEMFEYEEEEWTIGASQ